MSRKRIRVVGAMLENEPGRYLITQRRSVATLPLLWEFPGGRAEEGEEDEAALRREMREALGIEIAVEERATRVEHAYSGYDIDFRVYRCRLVSAESDIEHLGVRDHRWVTLAEMSAYEFPDADERTLVELLGLEGEAP